MHAADRAQAPGEPAVAPAERATPTDLAVRAAVHRPAARTPGVPVAPVGRAPADRVGPAIGRLTVAAARQPAHAREVPGAAAPVVRPAAAAPTPPAPPGEPPDSPAPGRRAPAKRGRRGGCPARVTLVQLVCWQVVAAAVVASLRQPLPVLLSVTAGAAAAVTLTGVRRRGRWLYEHLGPAAGYLCRARRRDLPADARTVPALLDQLVPGCAVRATADGGGPLMTTSHRDGMTAVLRPAGELPPPGRLLSMLEGRPGTVAVQTLWHQGVRHEGPAQRWLAVHAVRDAEITGDDLATVLGNAVRRIRRALKRDGVQVEGLDEAAGTALIAGLAHVTGGRTAIREDWRFWRSGGVCQATFRLRGWQRLGDDQAARLVTGLMTAARGTAVTVSVTARSGPAGTRVEGVLRLAATTESAVDAVCPAVVAMTESRGVRMARLDGAHARGLAASLPIGVCLS
jgi:type VII secretion protein EccE